MQCSAIIVRREYRALRSAILENLRLTSENKRNGERYSRNSWAHARLIIYGDPKRRGTDLLRFQHRGNRRAVSQTCYSGPPKKDPDRCKTAIAAVTRSPAARSSRKAAICASRC